MKFASEENVTKLLTKNEILQPKSTFSSLRPLSSYDLGKFLENEKNAKRHASGKYVFIEL